jgi:hypothetical protein
MCRVVLVHIANMKIFLGNFSPQLIRATRNRLKLTQAEFAEVLNVTRDAVASWESGRKTASGCAVRLLQLWSSEPRATLLTFRRMGLCVPDRGGITRQEKVRAVPRLKLTQNDP